MGSFSFERIKPFVFIGGLIVFLIVFVAVVSAFWPKYEERFFELGLLGRNRMAEDYYPGGNSTIGVGSSVVWYIYLHNHMGSPQNVSVRVKLLNATMEAPDDRGHRPSPYDFFVEFPVSLSVDETLLVPFSWRVVDADFVNGSVLVRGLVVNNQTVGVDVWASAEDPRLRMVFELWVYDEVSGEYRFEWESKGEVYSASVYIWFRVAESSG